MKRKDMLKKLYKVADDFMDSPDKRNLVDVLLDASVKLGMLPPYSKQKDLGCECGCKGRCEKGHEWDDV